MSIDPTPACRKAIARGVTLAALIAVSACGAQATTPGVPVAQSADIAPAAAADPHMSMAVPNLPDLFGLPRTISLAADFADLQASLDGRLGMAIMPVGGGDLTLLGDWNTGIAWSTIKVPLALAALRHDPSGMLSTAEAAITFSDNGAAQTLWNSLGTSNEAADAVESVLREGGDTVTDVADRKSRLATVGSDELMAFGATSWALADQVRFASRLPCLSNANSVVSLMSEITSSQSWGLGRLIGAEFKGGWGPDDETGDYTVRQFGLVPTLSGPIAVALAAEPTSGGFDDATDMLDRMALLFADHIPELHGGTCTH
ncbi:hypothetical protein HLB23_22395 [Nocardia uniformis]|uniref:Serine hydrolase n=1 Tax=Nocardia uniformis TaxID=53432 RepID=A0A849C4M8_9NOCA|nr:hypothetical protein [Nocardia uniformis]NNH72576.1 hypothetical protein [Nocardia uniformis]